MFSHVMATFCATTTELRNGKGLYGLQNLKYLLSGPLKKKVANSCHGEYWRQSMKGACVLESSWGGKVPD